MERTTYFGNPWVGMFVKSTDNVTIIPGDSQNKLENAVKSALKTEVLKVFVAQSNLLGVYVALNSHGMILPNVVREEELAFLRKTGLNIYISEEKQNAHGNNIAANDKIGIVNPHIPREEVSKMENVLGIELVPMSLAGYTTVGSACIITNDGFLTHYRTSDDEFSKLKEILKVYGAKGTVNTGTGFVSYGVVVNKHGYIAGEKTTAFELGRLEEALNMIK